MSPAYPRVPPGAPKPPTRPCRPNLLHSEELLT